VGQPIGRIGNIINGDILGGQSNLPWATAYTNPDAVLQKCCRLGVAYQPAAAYEALGTLVILLILLGIRRRGVRPGVVILTYVGLYSVSQFLLDFLRQTEPVIALGLKQLQLTAIATLVVVMPVLVIVWRRTEGRSGRGPEPLRDAASATPPEPLTEPPSSGADPEPLPDAAPVGTDAEPPAEASSPKRQRSRPRRTEG
jgi:prolipoprotein diacylglyceryltransferase